MNTPVLSKRLEFFVDQALRKIEKKPDLTPSGALSAVTTLRFPQRERLKLITTIKLRRKPKPRKLKLNKEDAVKNDHRHRKLLGEDF